MKRTFILLIPLLSTLSAHAGMIAIPEAADPSAKIIQNVLQQFENSTLQDIVINLTRADELLNSISQAIKAVVNATTARTRTNNLSDALKTYKQMLEAQAKRGSMGPKNYEGYAVKHNLPSYNALQSSMNQLINAMSPMERAAYDAVETTVKKLKKIRPMMGGETKIVMNFLDLTYKSATASRIAQEKKQGEFFEDAGTYYKGMPKVLEEE